MKARNILLVAVLLMACMDCAGIRRRRRSFGKMHPSAINDLNLTAEERTELIESNKHGKSIIAIVMILSVAIMSFLLLFWPKKTTQEVRRPSAFDIKQTQREVQFMLMHGRHPSRTGAQGKEYYKKYA